MNRRPTALKVLQGTFQPCRANPSEPQVIIGAPVMPDWLEGEARKEWDHLVPYLLGTRVLAEQDQSALALLCHLYGKIVDGARSGEVPSASLIAQYRILAAAFGLTPADRTRVHSAGPAKAKN